MITSFIIGPQNITEAQGLCKQEPPVLATGLNRETARVFAKDLQAADAKLKFNKQLMVATTWQQVLPRSAALPYGSFFPRVTSVPTF